VLQIEPENVKAIYHRGLAVVVLLSMNDHEFVSGVLHEDKLRSLEAKMHKFHKAFEITHSRTMALFMMQFSSFVQNRAGMSITMCNT